jgi:lipopolysaccharide export LptBFGC system permease protein LptF
MSRLFGYVGGQFARMALLTTAAVGASAVALDGLERAALLLGNGVTLATAAAYLGLRVATAAHLLAPVAAATAAALAVALLRHRGEWDAMRSIGAGPGQLLSPFAAAGLALAATLVAYEGFVLPRAIEQTSRHEAAEIMGGPVRLGTGDGPRWWWLEGGVLVAEEVSPAAERLDGAHWFAFGDRGEVTQRIDAGSLTFAEGDWQIEHGARRTMLAPDEVTVASGRTLALPDLTPAGIRRRLLPLAQHDLGSLASDPRPEARYTLHARLAHPAAVGLVVLLVAWLAAVVRPGRVLAVAMALGVVAVQAMLDLGASALAPALGWSPLLPWGGPALLAGVLAAAYLTSNRDASERNQPLVQSA